jgi:hypothetical protein
MGSNEVVVDGNSIDIALGTYQAFFSFSEVKTSDAWGDFRVWGFEIPGAGDISGGSSMAVGPKSKGGRWLAAILGRVPEKGERIDLDALVGRPCLVVVGLNKNDWTEVQDVLPPMANQAPAPQPVAAPVAPAPVAAPAPAPVPVAVAAPVAAPVPVAAPQPVAPAPAPGAPQPVAAAPAVPIDPATGQPTQLPF